MGDACESSLNGIAKNNRIGFREACSMFGDPLSITIPDPDHAGDDKT